MPVPDDKAVHLMEIQALRAITDNLARIGKQLDRQSETLNQVQGTVHEIDKRLVAIESNRIDQTVNDLAARIDKAVEKMAARIDLLEDDLNVRRGALRSAEWLSKFGPWLVALFASLAAVIGWDRAT